MSHGGLIGTQEAVFHGVPLLGVPIYADQYNNLLQAEELGFAKIQLYHDINEETLRNNLHEMLDNDSYKKKAEEISRRFKDRPMTPLDTAMFWIEYVIRNKGADFMKNPALKLSWIESNMLDVYGFLLLIVIVTASVIFYTLKAILNLLFSKNSTKNIKKKKNN